MLDLPSPIAAPLLEDPVAAAALVRPLAAPRQPLHSQRGHSAGLCVGAFNGGDGIIALVLQALVLDDRGIDQKAIFDGVIDPTTQLEPLP